MNDIASKIEALRARLLPRGSRSDNTTELGVVRPDDVSQSIVHIHTIADRKVTVVKPDAPGSGAAAVVGEAMFSQVEAKLYTDANIPFDYAMGEVVRSVRDDEINARRKAGLADLCEGEECTNELGMHPHSLRLRSMKPHPWLCLSCAMMPDPARRAALKLARSTPICEKAGCENRLVMTDLATKLRAKRAHPWLCSKCRKDPVRKAVVSHRCEAIDCGEMLGMSETARRKRETMPHPWLCQSCAAVNAGRTVMQTKWAGHVKSKVAPQRCEMVGCENMLGTSNAVRRKRKQHPWLCHRCSTSSARCRANKAKKINSMTRTGAEPS